MNNRKYLIAIPCMDSMPTPFVAALTSLRWVGAFKVSFLSNSLVYDARNILADEAIETGADCVLWLDSDMYFQPDLMERLARHIDNGLDMVTGLYFKRTFPTSPLIYKTVDIRIEEENLTGHADRYADYPDNQLFEIEGCGFGAVMVTTKLIKDVTEAYGKPFLPYPGILGEDLSFCYRAKQLGYKMYCDSAIKVGHVGMLIYGEQDYK